MKLKLVPLFSLLVASSTLSFAAERESAEAFHTRTVEEAVLRVLATADFSPAQRAVIEEGLFTFASDRAEIADHALSAEPRTTRPLLSVTQAELEQFRAPLDEEPEPPNASPEEPAQPTPPTAPDPEVPNSAPDGVTSSPQPVLPFGGIVCIPGNQLLLGGRFLVNATVTDLIGQVYTAGACRMTNVAGYFFFFDPTNVEVPVKMLNACSGGNPPTHWIFITGLTNFGVQTTFFDLFTGVSLTHTNPVGQIFPSSINQQTPFSCL